MQIGRTHHEILALGVTVLHLRSPEQTSQSSGETTSQPRILTLLHSRSALMPWSWVFSMTIWPEYHNAARHLSVSSQFRIVRPWSCQKGYRRLKKQCCASTFRLSFKALSPVRRPVKGAVFLGGGRHPVEGSFSVKCLVFNDSHIKISFHSTRFTALQTAILTGKPFQKCPRTPHRTSGRDLPRTIRPWSPVH